jgi:hypothetical protein
MIDAGAGMLLLNLLQDRLFDTEIVGEYGESLFGLARETKDAAEIAQMAEAGRLTGIVVGETQEFVRKHSVRDDADREGGRRAAHDRRCQGVFCARGCCITAWPKMATRSLRKGARPAFRTTAARRPWRCG